MNNINLLNSKTHFILFSSNYDYDLNFIGTKVNIKTLIPNKIENRSYKFFYENSSNQRIDFSHNFFKNRVIFSTKINLDDLNPPKNITLLTQQNLFHNIKFIHKDNDFNKPRILFVKYNVTNNKVNNNQYLFNPNNNGIIDLENIRLNDILLDFYNTDSNIDITIDTNKNLELKNLYYYFNIYKPFINSDYYKFKFTDFINLNSLNLNLNSLSATNFNLKNVSLKNNFNSNSLINYNENNFKNLFYFQHIGAIDKVSSKDVSNVYSL